MHQEMRCGSGGHPVVSLWLQAVDSSSRPLYGTDGHFCPFFPYVALKVFRSCIDLMTKARPLPTGVGTGGYDGLL